MELSTKKSNSHHSEEEQTNINLELMTVGRFTLPIFL